jgi:hypothetical protein
MRDPDISMELGNSSVFFIGAGASAARLFFFMQTRSSFSPPRNRSISAKDSLEKPDERRVQKRLASVARRVPWLSAQRFEACRRRMGLAVWRLNHEAPGLGPPVW